jgi:hypothetical protein
LRNLLQSYRQGAGKFRRKQFSVQHNQFSSLDLARAIGCARRVAPRLSFERIVMPAAPNPLLTRRLLVSFGMLSLLLASPQARAEDKVLRVGTLKLIHGITPYFYEKFAPAGYRVEVVPFESPTDGKNAVLTGTVDTCVHARTRC